MDCLATAATLLCLLGAWAASQPPKTVFLDKQHASAVISRQKRANAGNEENLMPADLQRECQDEVCSYEEAREFFQDSYRTDIFWSVYIDGDQCAEKPCKNGALCSDSVGGYDCVCKSGFTGVHCETDNTACLLSETGGCSQFCKPGYVSYECSCAHGWKLDNKDKNKCVSAVSYPCGKVNSLSQWERRQSTLSIISLNKNVRSILECDSTMCPWQAILRSAVSEGFCSGVILKENLVLTSAQCANKYGSFQVAVGKRRVSTHEDGQQTLDVKVIHIHPRYAEDKPENDLAVIELHGRIVFKKTVIAACLPERDFAMSVLMTGELPAVVTGWKEPGEGVEGQGPLSYSRLSYNTLPECIERQPGLVTNKMGCTAPQTDADCRMGSGSPLLTLYREVFYLTGVVSQPPGANCSHGYIYQKVSRFMDWLEPIWT
ncbi:protein Z, vitamin K-dependent plasma glycoprotein a [Lampris incognitus]|uniref:protein Z, vitamin K-dependent plasma glycoprotein a n=1 Tax=Lampris incognitus TaxID=2546036 RepID=UPI0024B558BF|nr:protein Z, vitamin K-dependent plasma glycoprotein a [Lampris incognitus]XP_056143852.1 protein Z, vitamin K-dependent plasma glycoprotein a [Lampris incognitus]